MRPRVRLLVAPTLIAATLLCSYASFRAGLARGSRSHSPSPSARSAPRAEDTDRDGRPDRWLLADERGVTLSIATDRNRDGRPDRNEHLVGGLRPVRVDYDEDFNGSYDRYDSITREGYAILTHYDRDWDDAPERWVQRGASGTIISEWTDADENGAPERYREFDARGRLTEEGIDADGNGLYEVQRFFNVRWRDPARPEYAERDDDGDGQFEKREVFNEEGALILVQTDSDDDGRRDRWQYLRPASTDGGAPLVLKIGLDRNGDGSPDEWRYPEADGVRVGHDDDDDRDIDRWDRPGPPSGWCAARCTVR
jgi:hypothetical protein